MVPLETPILLPASSCDNPSKSMSLSASSSAASISIGFGFRWGFGMNLFMGGVLSRIIGLGILPLLPLLLLLCHIGFLYVIYSHYDLIRRNSYIFLCIFT